MGERPKSEPATGDARLLGVPGEVCRSFIDSESHGRFFQAEIRDRYPFNRLED